MKRTLIALCCLLVAFAAGCAKEETYEAKPLTGIGAIFDESLGYYNEHPSVIELDGVRYVYYTRTAEKNTVSDTIAVRKGTFADGRWMYGEPRTLLAPSQDGWDSAHVYAPTVIKGRFRYGGKDYSYLMAYAGNSEEGRTDFSQIGLAVSEHPDGTFVRLDAPFITFDKYDYSIFGTTIVKGASEPSLVSFDCAGKAYLFYSCHTPSATPSTSRCWEVDFSDLDTIGQRAADRGLLVNTTGISDQGSVPSPKSADWAYDPDADAFYTVRDYYPAAAVAPTVSEGVQLLKADRFSALYLTDEVGRDVTVWQTVRQKIDTIDTADYESGDESRFAGYERIYSACLVRTAYGRIRKTDGRVSVIFTSSASIQTRPDDYTFTPALHEVSVGDNGEVFV